MSAFFGPGSIGFSRSDEHAELATYGRSTMRRKAPLELTENQPGAQASPEGLKYTGHHTNENGETFKTVRTMIETQHPDHVTLARGGPVTMLGFKSSPCYLDKDLLSPQQVLEANGGMSLSEAIREGHPNIVIPCPVERFHRYGIQKGIELFFTQSKIPADVQSQDARAGYLAKMFSHGPNKTELQQSIKLSEIFKGVISQTGTRNIIPYAIQLNIKSFESNFHIECFIEAPTYVKLPPPGSNGVDSVYTGLSDTDQHLQSWADIGGYSPAEDGTGRVREIHIPLTNRHASSVPAFIAPDSYNDALFTRWISIPIESLHADLKRCRTSDISVQVKRKHEPQKERSIKVYQFDVLRDASDSNNFCQWLYAENRTNLLRQLESHGVLPDDVEKFNGTIHEEGVEFMPVPVMLFDYLIAGFAERFNLNNIVMPLDELRVVMRPMHAQDLKNELKKPVPIAPSFTIGVQIAYDLYNVKGVSDGKSLGDISEQLRARGIAMRHFLDIAAAGQPTDIFVTA